MCDNKSIWNELVKTNYKFTNIEITIEEKLVELNIYFSNSNDLDIFTNSIYNIYFQSMNNVELFNNSLQLNLFDSNIINLFEMLNFPSNVDIIKIMVENKIEKLIESQIYKIKILNLPINLSQLKIISNYPFDLSNLPTQLILLDIAESNCKFNLDYLPNSVQILYLPNIYDFNNLSNLPSSLEEINFSNNTVYKSIGELVEKFNK